MQWSSCRGSMSGIFSDFSAAGATTPRQKIAKDFTAEKVTCGGARCQRGRKKTAKCGFTVRGASRIRFTYKVPPVPGLLGVIDGQQILRREEELGMAEPFRVVGLEPFDDRLGFGHVGEVAGVTEGEKRGQEWCVDDPKRVPKTDNLLGVKENWCEEM